MPLERRDGVAGDAVEIAGDRDGIAELGKQPLAAARVLARYRPESSISTAISLLSGGVTSSCIMCVTGTAPPL